MLWSKKEEKGEKNKVDAKSPSEVVKVPSSQDGSKNEDRVPWSRRLNPLKTNILSPVPEERQPSKEHNANWLSKLTFHWVTPILSVSVIRSQTPTHLGLELMCPWHAYALPLYTDYSLRLDTNGLWIRTTYG